ncbi:MAG: UPF0280 family protein [Proteobacteria bacterium]|nr:UPF0280 family protein [Pseudomonadota bacterium]MBU1140586.1 UPF0280 family protein [Pseudomonadota bacterium]MBU1232823.1 UPF0280 family protein [Pseudomonadota bacterium]MBU1418407.1 UPF0280 family protein [Pseudomonadota bacterium]MBU1455335.1 UPF0280 family protein [Pseudomonadota bacterium]
MKSHKRKRKPESYSKRDYRQLVSQAGLVSTQIRIEETDLHILAEQGVAEQATDLVLQYRAQLEGYIVKYPQFCATLDPLPQDKTAPPLVRDMLIAGIQAGVGPMAAVAGGIAEYVGRGLMAQGFTEIMVENGGDIFLQRSSACSVAIFAGESPLSYKVGVRVSPAQMPLGICTSSGTVGHSLSLGEADSVTVLARSTLLADAAATRLGNEVGQAKGGKAGVARALDTAKEIPGIIGVVVICGELMGATGDVELVKIDLQSIQ